MELNYITENDKLKKNIKLNELFLCPKCFKKIPLFISFDLQKEKNENIIMNYICSCDKNFQSINLEDLLENGIKKNMYLQNVIHIQKKENTVLNANSGYALIASWSIMILKIRIEI